MTISPDISSGRPCDRGGLPGRPGLRRVRARRRRPPQDRQPAEGAKFESAEELCQRGRGRTLAGLDALLLQPGDHARGLGQRRGMAEIRSVEKSKNNINLSCNVFLKCCLVD